MYQVIIKLSSYYQVIKLIDMHKELFVLMTVVIIFRSTNFSYDGISHLLALYHDNEFVLSRYHGGNLSVELSSSSIGT